MIFKSHWSADLKNIRTKNLEKMKKTKIIVLISHIGTSNVSVGSLPNNIFTDSIESVRNDVNHVRVSQVLRDVLQTSESSKNMYVCMVILRLSTVVDFQIVLLM